VRGDFYAALKAGTIVSARNKVLIASGMPLTRGIVPLLRIGRVICDLIDTRE